MAGKDGLRLLMERLHDGPAAAKASVNSSIELSLGEERAAAPPVAAEKPSAKADFMSRPSSALLLQRTRMMSELKKLQAPSNRSNSNSKLRDRERQRSQNNGSSFPMPGDASELQWVASGSRAAQPVVQLEHQSFKGASHTNAVDIAKSGSRCPQARPAVKESSVIAPEVLAQQRKQLRCSADALNAKKGRRLSCGSKRKKPTSEDIALASAPSAPCLSNRNEDLPRAAHGPDILADVASQIGHQASSSASSADGTSYGAPALTATTTAWSAAEVPATAVVARTVEHEASASAGPTASFKSTPMAWASRAEGPAASTSTAGDAAALTDSAAPPIAPPKATAASAPSSVLSTVVKRNRPSSGHQSNMSLARRGITRSAASAAEAKMAAALNALDLQADALLEAAVGKRSQYLTGHADSLSKPDLAALLSGAEPAGQAQSAEIQDITKKSASRTKPSSEKEKLDGSRFLAQTGSIGRLEEVESYSKSSADVEKLAEAGFLSQAGKMSYLEELECPNILDALVPASTLDLMDLDAHSESQLGKFSKSLGKPSKHADALDELPYSIPFDLSAWEKSGPEAFGERFGAKFRDSEQSINSKGTSKALRKNRKEMEWKVEYGGKHRSKTMDSNYSKAAPEGKPPMPPGKPPSAVEPPKAVATVMPPGPSDSAKGVSTEKTPDSVDKTQAPPQRRRPQSALDPGKQVPNATRMAADAQTAEVAASSSEPQGARHVVRPSSASTTMETRARLAAAGFDNSDTNVPYSSWDTCKEVYSAWDDHEDWEDSPNDWGMGDTSMQLAAC